MKKYLILLCLVIATQASLFSEDTPQKLSDTELIYRHLEKICKTDDFRNYKNPHILNNVAEYLFSEFGLYCDTVYFQTFKVKGIEYKNVIASIGSKNKDKVVVGAHYDVCSFQEGADDNASGVVALLELARLFKDTIPNINIELVAYTLEEPPFFGTESMGSYVHAKSLYKNNEEILGMVCLDMIGYFDYDEDSQNYPAQPLKWIYGDEGDYIMVLKKKRTWRFWKYGFESKFKKKFKKHDLIDTKSMSFFDVGDIYNLSDHINYWHFAYPAIMITNTAYYRNPNYHAVTDKLETLDIVSMSKVIDQLYLTLLEMEK